MRKRFIKFRISRVIPTFHSCRSKDPSTLPSNPVPSFLHHNTSSTTTSVAAIPHRKLNTNTPPSSHPKPHRSSIKRHVSSAFLSARHGCLRPRPSPSPEPSHTQSPPPSSLSKQRSHHHVKWGKISNHPHWHVITKIPPPDHHHNYDSTPPRRKIYTSAASDTDRENDVVFLPPPPIKTRAKKTRRKRRNSFHKSRISTSSDSGLFSEDNDNDKDDHILERESLVSTTDSPKSKERETKTTTTKRRSSFESLTASSPVPARLSEFMRKMTPCRAVANGKVRESFAMVKKSEDPYEDFKRSMVEMVVEKQMFEEKELEELLRCFLSLNSERHHDAIVTAFTQIWKSLFCDQHLPSPHH